MISNDGLLLGLSFGCLLALVFCCAVLFMTSGNRKFSLLGITTAVQLLALISLSDFAPGGSWWQLHNPGIFMALSLITGILFAVALLPLRKINVQLLQGLRILIALGVMLLLFSLFMPTETAMKSLLFYALVVSVTMAATGIRCWQQKINAAEFFSISWVVCTIALLAVALWGGLLPERMSYTLSVLVCNSLVSAILLFSGLIRQVIGDKTRQIGLLQQVINDIRTNEKIQRQKLAEEKEELEALEVSLQTRNFELEVTLRELEDKNQELEEKNTQDALTGIRNRRYFDKKYLAEFRRSRREQTELSVLMIDIDHFKAVNDNHGHLAGDDVIRFVGHTLRDIIKRPSDAVCRYGGEEFALVLPSTSTQGARQIAQTIRQTIAAAMIETCAGKINITVSCGICTAIANGDMEQNHYIEMADKALYLAKRQGRNCVIHHDDVPVDTPG